MHGACSLGRLVPRERDGAEIAIDVNRRVRHLDVRAVLAQRIREVELHRSDRDRVAVDANTHAGSRRARGRRSPGALGGNDVPASVETDGRDGIRADGKMQEQLRGYLQGDLEVKE